MTAGTEILNYQPNEKLGLGGNADIPAIYSDNNVINQTGRDLMLLNHENNVNLWSQKIADRDKQLELIDKGQIATGRVLDRDKPWLKEREAQVDKSFEELVKQKPGTDKYAEAYRNYQKNLTNYKDAVTVAQHNQLGVDTLNVAESKEPLAFKQKRIAEFRKKELSKPAGASVGSYIPVLDYDADAINNWGEGVVSGSVTSTPTGTTEKVSVTDVAGKPSKTVTTKTNAPLSGKQPQAVGEIIYKDGLPYSRTKQFIDFDKIKYNKISQYADDAGEQHENQENHRKAYETAPDNIYEPVMNRIIQRVKDYNSDKGLQQGDAGYLDPTETAKKLGIDPMTGKRTGQRIMFSTPEFAALTALANYGGSYAPATDTLLKDQAELALKKDANDANEWYKRALGNAALKKANAYAGHMAAKVKALKDANEKEKFLDEIYNRNIIEQQKLVDSAGGSKLGLTHIQAQNSLPVFTFDGSTPKQLRPIGATDVKDDAGHIVGYKGGYYRQQYVYNGKPLSVSQLWDKYSDFKDAAGSGWTGGFDEYLKEAIKNDWYDVKLIGENGATDRKLSRAAQIAISNKMTKKDQDGVFEPAPTDDISQE